MEDRASQEDIIPEKADEDDKQQEGDPDEEGDDDKQQEDPCVWKFICYHRSDKEGDWYCGVCDSAVEGFAKARQKWPKCCRIVLDVAEKDAMDDVASEHGGADKDFLGSITPDVDDPDLY